jgi:hypothetical protein
MRDIALAVIHGSCYEKHIRSSRQALLAGLDMTEFIVLRETVEASEFVK